jgi:transposase
MCLGADRSEQHCGDAGQLDLQALHRVRERLVCQRTSVINQIRAFLLERGIAVRQGLRALRTEMPIILGMTDKLPPRKVHRKEHPSPSPLARAGERPRMDQAFRSPTPASA